MTLHSDHSIPGDARRVGAAIAILVLLAFFAAPTFAQGLGEYGDAPEGQTAYPGTAIPGLFPTCLGGPAGKIQHAPNLPFDSVGGPTTRQPVLNQRGVRPV